MKQKGRFKRTVAGCWRWSWLVTLPVVAIFILWVIGTVNVYRTFKLDYITFMPLQLSELGSLEAGFLVSDFKTFMSPRGAARGEGLERVDLFIKESNIKRLNSHLPYSGREYVEARLMYPGGDIHDVKVRYRGDFSYHWIGRKKSIRVKTKKSRLYDGMRQFNLIIPKFPVIFNNHLSYELARRLGILSPVSRLVEVYINGSYMGVEVLTEQLGEQFLRRNSRMPGDLYVGEVVGKDAVPDFKELYTNANYWSKSAINNHNPPEWNEAMKELVDAVFAEDMGRVMELIDLESWARLAAFTTICQTVHMDSNHNWRLYFDPAKGRFEPIVWDPVGFHFNGFVKRLVMQSNRMDVISSIVFERLHRDHRFLVAKHDAVEEFFASGGDEFIMGLIADTSRLEKSIARDNNLHFSSTYILPSAEVVDRVTTFKKDVEELFGTIREAYLETPPRVSFLGKKESGEIQVNIEGFTPIRSLAVEYSEPVPADGLRAKVRYLKDGIWRENDISGRLTISGRVVTVDLPMLSARRMAARAGRVSEVLRDAVIEPATYVLKIDGAGGEIISVNAGYAGGRGVPVKRADMLEVHPLDGNFHVAYVADRPGELVWTGDKEINGVMEVTDNLTVKPGTTLRFAPGASLIVRGRLFVDGSADAPVRFVPRDVEGEPWGAVVLAGPGADGSTLKGCEFTGGSGLRHKLVEYSAMLSVHAVDGVVVDGCSFSDSRVVDDMVHAVYSGVTFKDSLFKRSKSDALDLDYVNGRVENTAFFDSGNDALDLMSSSVVVTGSRMRGSGDKGISVGEGTEVMVWNTRIENNLIGVQAKDRSNAVLYNVELSGNEKTIDAYRKNWQYGDGGHAYIYKSRLKGASPALTADKWSTIEIYDSFLDGRVGGKKKRVRIDANSDSDPAFAARARSGLSYAEQLKEAENAAPLAGLIRPDVRGVIGEESDERP